MDAKHLVSLVFFFRRIQDIKLINKHYYSIFPISTPVELLSPEVDAFYPEIGTLHCSYRTLMD